MSCLFQTPGHYSNIFFRHIGLFTQLSHIEQHENRTESFSTTAQLRIFNFPSTASGISEKKTNYMLLSARWKKGHFSSFSCYRKIQAYIGVTKKKIILSMLKVITNHQISQPLIVFLIMVVVFHFIPNIFQNIL